MGQKWKRGIALRAPSLQHVLLVVIAMPALLLLSMVMGDLVKEFVPSLMDILHLQQMGIEEQIKEMVKNWPLGFAILVVGIGPAIGEELWCRGFLGNRLSSRYGLWGGVLLTSFLFGLIHVEPPQAVMAMLMGIVIHLSYLATRSILTAMLIHFLNNSLEVLRVADVFPLLDTLAAAYNHSPILSVVVSLALVGVVSYALFRTRARVSNAEEHETFQFLSTLGEVPREMRPRRFVTGSLTALEVGILLVAACVFAGVWFGLG